jgi:hypothetical protein
MWHPPGESGRLDSNQRPHGPEPCALAKLSYAPWFVYRRTGSHFVNANEIGPFCWPAGLDSVMGKRYNNRPVGALG